MGAKPAHAPSPMTETRAAALFPQMAAVTAGIHAWTVGVIGTMTLVLGVRGWLRAAADTAASGSNINATKSDSAQIRALAVRGRITLVYAAHDEEHNNAVVICELLLNS